jgi:hypothetical protein
VKFLTGALTKTAMQPIQNKPLMSSILACWHIYRNTHIINKIQPRTGPNGALNNGVLQTGDAAGIINMMRFHQIERATYSHPLNSFHQIKILLSALSH